jgi:hypothetical protein
MKKTLTRATCALERALFRRGLPAAGRRTLPHFLGLGPGQTGTTWLARHLAAHPGVYVAAKKETHYFSRHFDEWSLRYYASLFAAGGERVAGEITPGYSILKRQRIAQVARLMPDVRLILTIRNPIERSWSAARKVMPRLGMAIDSVSDEDLFAYFRSEWAYTRPGIVPLTGAYEAGLLEGYYSRSIDNWLSEFKEEQLLPVFFDDIKSQPGRVLSRVCSHIGVEAQPLADDSALKEPVNRGQSHAMPERVRDFLVAHYRTQIETLAARLGGPATTWLDELG